MFVDREMPFCEINELTWIEYVAILIKNNDFLHKALFEDFIHNQLILTKDIGDSTSIRFYEGAIWLSLDEKKVPVRFSLLPFALFGLSLEENTINVDPKILGYQRGTILIESNGQLIHVAKYLFISLDKIRDGKNFDELSDLAQTRIKMLEEQIKTIKDNQDFDINNEAKFAFLSEELIYNSRNFDNKIYLELIERYIVFVSDILTEQDFAISKNNDKLVEKMISTILKIENYSEQIFDKLILNQNTLDKYIPKLLVGKVNSIL